MTHADGAGRIAAGRVGDYVDVSGLDPHQVDHFLFLVRASGLAYRSGTSGVELAVGHREAIDEMLARAEAFEGEVVGRDSDDEADEIATLGKRALGYILDSIIVSVAGAVATLAALAVAGIGVSRPLGAGPADWEVVIVWTTPIVTSFVLICVSTFRKGRTIGKSGARTLVIDTKTSAEISFRQSFVRWIVPIAPGFVAAAVGPFVSVPLVVWCAATAAMVAIYGVAWFDGSSRGFHDRLAGTVVVVDRRPRRQIDQLQLEEQLHPRQF